MIDLNTLSTYQPEKEGVVIGFIYFLFHDDTLIYIGSTVNLKDRIKAHRTSKYFTSVRYEPVDIALVRGKELEYINHFKPFLNLSGAKHGYEKYETPFLVIGDYVHVSGKGSFKLKDGKGFELKRNSEEKELFYINGEYIIWQRTKGFSQNELIVEVYSMKKRNMCAYDIELDNHDDYEIDHINMKFMSRGQVMCELNSEDL